jgi:hypothetical protein
VRGHLHPGARLLLAGGLAAAVTAGAATAKTKPAIRAYSPEADTYVTAAEPDGNYGRSRMLRAARSPRTTTYLRFRIRTLPPDTSVILLLHSTSGGRASYEVRSAGTEDWAERRLTYANAPRLSMRYAAGKIVGKGPWNAVDVTSLVAGNRVNLAITARGRVGVAFHSRESKDGPRLVVRKATEHTDLAELVRDSL